ncbi:glycosyl hydrolase [Paraphoma chrysanthemicola]|nr:glycosyl hydrolase [Paraphoma chrysanthemicola]
MTSKSIVFVAADATLFDEKNSTFSLSLVASRLDETSSVDLSKQWRPAFHLVAPRGWLNDPCGPGYDPIKDVYHLGFQWNPNDTEWGNISWGAAISHDMITWQVLERPSMEPSSVHDTGGVFSGCMLPTAVNGSADGTLTAIYTSVSRLPIHHTLPYHRKSESVALATSTDSGRTWTRHLRNSVLVEPPPNLDVTGWRDPFVRPWPAMDEVLRGYDAKDAGESLYAIVAGGIRGKTPTAFLYRVHAQALDNWRYLGPLITPGANYCPSPRWTGDLGLNWEVTNFLSLSSTDGAIARDFLICGVEGCLATADAINVEGNMRATTAQMWICGLLEPHEGGWMKYRYSGKLDHGTYYADNSFWDPKTRQHIIHGWVLEDDLDSKLRRQQGWAGAISLPRILKLHVLHSVVGTLMSPLSSIGSIELLPEDEDGSKFTVVSLCAIPDSRLSNLRGPSILSIRQTNPMILGTLAQWEMKLDFEVMEDEGQVGFDIVHSATEYTRVYFEISSENIIVDRNYSSSHPAIRRCREQAPHTLLKIRQPYKDDSGRYEDKLETLSFHVFYDCSILEVFVNERTAITTRIYPTSGTSNGVKPFITGGGGTVSDISTQVLRFDLWALNKTT